jgi:hypothetical protein
MKIEEAQAFYFDYAGKLNDRIRTLAITGIGIIWVFKQTTETGPWVPQKLLGPGVLLVAALGLDVLQLAYGMVVWGRVAKREDKRTPGYEINVPNWVNWPTAFMVYSRILLVLLGYVLLIMYLKGRFA